MNPLLQQSNEKEFPRPLTESDQFYRAIHPDWIKEDGKVSTAAFTNKEMSVDWADLSTPCETFDRWPQWGECRGVASITAGLCWQNDQNVEYTPKDDNCSHSDVVGKKRDRIRKNFAKSARLLIPRLIPPRTPNNPHPQPIPPWRCVLTGEHEPNGWLGIRAL